MSMLSPQEGHWQSAYLHSLTHRPGQEVGGTQHADSSETQALTGGGFQAFTIQQDSWGPH